MYGTYCITMINRVTGYKFEFGIYASSFEEATSIARKRYLISKYHLSSIRLQHTP